MLLREGVLAAYWKRPTKVKAAIGCCYARHSEHERLYTKGLVAILS